MPNQITSTGLVTKTSAELIAELTTAYQTIYGADINLDSDTPDGQMMRIYVQSVLDLQDLLTQIYNNFDPDYAFGKVLDQRVAINGIQRKAGTYTLTNITVTTTASVTLQGLDLYPDSPYTVSDESGTEWYLVDTQSPVVAGSYAYEFRAKDPGATLTIPNTITVPVTVVIGVASVNNPTTYTSLGLDEETDAQLRVRRQRSVALASQGYLAGLLASLENINGITTAIVYENTTGATDANGIPSHSIWVIIGGTVDDADVATAIYNKRNAGCGMRGTQTYTITQVDGSPFVVKWDIVEPENLYISFVASSIDGVNTPNVTGIKDYLVANLAPGVGKGVNINQVATLVQEADANCLVTMAEVSNDGLSWDYIAEPSALNKQLAVSAANINISVV